MLHAFMGKCASISAYLPVTSLQEPIETDANDLEFEQVIDAVADPTVDLESDYLSTELNGQVRQFVQHLPERLRTIVYRHYWLGETQSLIAEDYGVSRSAICHALAKVNSLGRKFFGVAEQ